MPQARFLEAARERRRAEAAGRVVLQVLRALPDCAMSGLLRNLINITIVDPKDRALFDFLRRDDFVDRPLPVTSPKSPALSGGAAAQLYGRRAGTSAGIRTLP